MPDHPIRGSDLRTPAPTLEPDDVFVARLSALAAANAQQGGAAPLATWRVGLAAASVAAVLVGVAWLAGLDPSGSPNPAPTPATTPTTPVETPTPDTPAPAPSRATVVVDGTDPVFGAAPPDTEADLPEQPGRTDKGAAEQVDSGRGNGTGPGTTDSNGNGNGPDAHAGEHPNEHATTKSNNAHQHAGDKPGRGAGGRSDR